MKKNLVIFGTGDIAELAHFYFSNQSNYNVVGFSVDRLYLKESVFCQCPVVPFDEILQTFPSNTHEVFVALGYSNLNTLRREKYQTAKALGYPIARFISPRANLFHEERIGENCFILEDNTIQPFVTIGNNVTLWSGNHIGHHSIIRNHSFIASHVVISGGVDVGEQCFIGVNATVRDHIRIGDRCIIGAGALLLANTEPDGIYMASPTERSRVPSSRLKRI